MDSTNIIDKLESLLKDVRENLIQSAGGKSVCAIHKSGLPSDFLKYNEGKEFIIRRTISLLKKDTSRDNVRSFLKENKDIFKAYKTSEATISTTWQSYADGGLDGISLIENWFDLS